jgi:glycosyltransferase involved in cell wall biosynthesis
VPIGRGHLKLLLLVHDISAVGGMEIQLAALAGGLASAGHDVKLVSIRSRGGDLRPDDPSLDPGVELVHLGAADRVARARAVPRLARLARASDLVHCTGWDTSLWGRLAAILARRPAIVAEHSGGREYEVSTSGAPRARWIALHNRLLDSFTAATVICANRQRDVLHAEGVNPRSIVLIPNGVPVTRLRAEARRGLTREQLGIPSEAKVLAQVASFRPMKRQVLTLETTARLREAVGDVRVVFAGDGPALQNVRTIAEERGADWAVFLGRQRNVASVFGLADLAVLPSASEAMPMSIIEAIAVGVPVVATDVGDVAETLDRTGAGLHVPPEDPDAFFRCCHALLADQSAHQRFSAAAVAARHEVDAETMVCRYEDVFDRILCGRGMLAGRPDPTDRLVFRES